jgi:hypothetical protein
VSDELNEKIEEALEDEEAEAPALRQFLWVGQTVRCVVLSTAVVGGEKAKRKHISLSIKPSRYDDF